ncbi:hypothetical protein BG004_005349 [Podila humilis]|nr:hypothetical protein BG004_005349 [Podila humilis]
MQRGIQATAPEPVEIKDAHTSPRSSNDLGRRVSALSAPIHSTIYQKSTSSQSTPSPTSLFQNTVRNPSQRRISLPSIVESPSSPVISTAPRQSCDFGRTPLSTEPLHKSMESVHLRGNSGYAAQVSSSSSRSAATSMVVLQSTSSTAPRSGKITSELPENGTSATRRSILDSRRASASTQDAGKPPRKDRPAKQPLSSPGREASIQRRRSLDASGFLSPQSANIVNRRRSFEQVGTSRPKRTAESKSRRTSDASTGSENTVVSGHSSCLTLVDVTSAGNDQHNEMVAEELLAPQRYIDSSSVSRSKSQPLTEDDGSKRRASFAFESSINRPSLDQRRPLHSSADDSDRAFRRRTLHAHTSPELGRVQLGGSLLDTGESKPRKSTSSSIGYHEAAPRHSFSGSSTISGRFSRMWSYGSNNNNNNNNNSKECQKESGSVGNWRMGEFAEASGEAAAHGLVKSDSIRSRTSVFNRLSGLWKRS